MKVKYLILLLFVITGHYLSAQIRIEPPSWWAGMKHQKLQLMVHAENIAETKPVFEYSGVTLESVVIVESPNYLFLNLQLAEDLKPGTFVIDFKKGKKVVASYSYSIKERKHDPSWFRGFDNSDVIYLLMPDRFANGDTTNDDMEGMLEKADRSEPSGRKNYELRTKKMMETRKFRIPDP